MSPLSHLEMDWKETGSGYYHHLVDGFSTFCFQYHTAHKRKKDLIRAVVSLFGQLEAWATAHGVDIPSNSVLVTDEAYRCALSRVPSWVSSTDPLPAPMHPPVVERLHGELSRKLRQQELDKVPKDIRRALEAVNTRPFQGSSPAELLMGKGARGASAQAASRLLPPARPYAHRPRYCPWDLGRKPAVGDRVAVVASRGRTPFGKGAARVRGTVSRVLSGSRLLVLWDGKRDPVPHPTYEACMLPRSAQGRQPLPQQAPAQPAPAQPAPAAPPQPQPSRPRRGQPRPAQPAPAPPQPQPSRPRRGPPLPAQAAPRSQPSPAQPSPATLPAPVPRATDGPTLWIVHRLDGGRDQWVQHCYSREAGDQLRSLCAGRLARANTGGRVHLPQPAADVTRCPRCLRQLASMGKAHVASVPPTSTGVPASNPGGVHENGNLGSPWIPNDGASLRGRRGGEEGAGPSSGSPGPSGPGDSPGRGSPDLPTAQGAKAVRSLLSSSPQFRDKMDRAVQDTRATEGDILHGMAKEWAKVSTPRHVRWTTRRELPPDARLLWGMWVVTPGSKDGDPVKARWVWNGALEKGPAGFFNGLVYTHAAMVQDATQLLQCCWGLSNNRALWVGDLRGAFNSSKTWAELTSVDPAWGSRRVFGVPPAVAGVPPDAIVEILYPAYGLGDGPAGLVTSLAYSLTQELPLQATTLPELYALHRSPGQHPTLGHCEPPDSLVSAYMDDLMMALGDLGTDFASQLESRGWTFSKLQQLGGPEPVQLCGATYTPSRDGIPGLLRTSPAVWESLQPPTTEDEYQSQLGKLGYWAQKACPAQLCNTVNFPRTPNPQAFRQLAKRISTLRGLPPDHPFLHPWRLVRFGTWANVRLVAMADISFSTSGHRSRGGQVLALVEIPDGDWERMNSRRPPVSKGLAKAAEATWQSYPCTILECSSAMLTRDCGHSSSKGETVNGALAAARLMRLYQGATRAGILREAGCALYLDHFGVYESVTLRKPVKDDSIAAEVSSMRQSTAQGMSVRWHPGKDYPAHELATPVHWSKSVLASIMKTGLMSLPLWS